MLKLLLLGWLYTAVKFRMWSFSSCVQEKFPFILKHEALWRAVFIRLELIYCLPGAREGKNLSFRHYADSCLMLHLHVGETDLHLFDSAAYFDCHATFWSQFTNCVSTPLCIFLPESSNESNVCRCRSTWSLRSVWCRNLDSMLIPKRLSKF